MGETRVALSEAGGNTAYIARICHEVNRAYCIATGEPNVAPPWEDFHHDLQLGVINGVKFLTNNPTATPRDQHEEWVKAKIAGGWVYGPEKSFEKMTHPCLVPYDQLPEAQKVKDYLFQAIIRAAHLPKAVHAPSNDGA